MLDEKVIERATRLIEVQWNERRNQVPMEISRVKGEANTRGVFHSSMTVLQIKDICEREIEIRSVIVWQSLVRVLRLLGGVPQQNLAEDLKHFVQQRVNEAYEELTRVLSANLMGMMKIEQVSLTPSRDHVIAKHEIEIDLFIDSQAGSSKEPQATVDSTSNYHFYGNVGAVQTGPGAEANVVQNLGTEDRAALEQALSLAREAISVAETISRGKREELLEIVDEATSELSKEKPNNTKLQTVFSTIATTIQSLASAQPAYQALKGALIPLGIILP